MLIVCTFPVKSKSIVYLYSYTKSNMVIGIKSNLKNTVKVNGIWIRLNLYICKICYRFYVIICKN